MKNKITITLLLLLISSSLFSQNRINKFDENGKRHGIWRKEYNNGNIRYKGTFNHGKEMGIFKFYAVSGEKKPIVIKQFTAGESLVKVQFFSKKGILKSEGYMKNKQRVGLWSFYFNDGKTLLSTEEYKAGKLEGEQKIFYKSGVVTKLAHYKAGKLHGNRKIYSKEGKILEDLTYKDGIVNGPAVIYDENAKIFAKGNYTNGIRTGTWEFMIDGEMIKTDNPYLIRNELEDTLDNPIRHEINSDPEKVLIQRR